MTPSRTPGLARFNASDVPTASELLREVCSCRSWGAAVIAGRPYADTEALCAAGDEAVRGLTPDDLAEALEGHPPIGRPEPGDPVSGREQSGVPQSRRAELLELGRAYQEIHGHVFLICATGRTGDQILAAFKKRAGNDTPTEREIVRTELGKINRVRLARLAEGERR